MSLWWSTDTVARFSCDTSAWHMCALWAALTSQPSLWPRPVFLDKLLTRSCCVVLNAVGRRKTWRSRKKIHKRIRGRDVKGEKWLDNITWWSKQLITQQNLMPLPVLSAPSWPWAVLCLQGFPMPSCLSDFVVLSYAQGENRGTINQEADYKGYCFPIITWFWNQSGSCSSC